MHFLQFYWLAGSVHCSRMHNNFQFCVNCLPHGCTFSPSRPVYQSMNLRLMTTTPPPPLLLLLLLLPLSPLSTSSVCVYHSAAFSHISQSACNGAENNDDDDDGGDDSDVERGSRDDSYSLLFSLRLLLHVLPLHSQWAVYTLFTFYNLSKHFKPCQFHNDVHLTNSVVVCMLQRDLLVLFEASESGFCESACIYYGKRSSKN